MRGTLANAIRYLALSMLCLSWSGSTIAQESGRVLGLNSPAWLISAGRVKALSPAHSIRAGDTVRTGRGGRVKLALADGSEVKLGERAEFVLNQLEESPTERGLFQGVLSVLRGAFRYTTTALGRSRRRNLEIRIAGITAGIRGTDVWGQANSEKDILCLIEGTVEVARGDDPAFKMSEPLTFYIAPRNAPALPVAPVDAQRLAGWAAQVELAATAGVMAIRGGMGVVLESDIHSANANATRERFVRAGFPAEVETVQVAETLRHRVVVRGFSGLADATAFARRMVMDYAVSGAFVVAPARP